MSDSSSDLSKAAMPIPMGVVANTGESRLPLTDEDFQRITSTSGPVSGAVSARGSAQKELGFASEVKDPMDLTQTGWGVLFASDAGADVQAALQPLLDWRKSQVKNDALFRVFAGADGVKPGQSAANWAARNGVTLVAPVAPSKGVPFYLLVVGSPQRIPFEFQQLLDLQWAVGRLYFDKVEDYAAYAQKVVEYEKGLAPARARSVALWMPRNKLDLSTPMLAGTLAPDFQGQVKDGKPIGHDQNFQVSAFVGDGQATKDNLKAIFRGKTEGGLPSVLFTGSHGAEWPIDDPAIQAQRQGALVTQEWTRGQPLQPGSYFAADDLQDDAQVHGMVYFMFACFGGGCPDTDSYTFAADGSPIKLAPTPFITALPQALLRRGVLAVVAHVDRAFAFAFVDEMGTPQAQLLRTVLELIMEGQRVGLATDSLNLQWSSLAAQLGLAQAGNRSGIPPQSQSSTIANLFVARDDARNYLVLGDPAVCLGCRDAKGTGS
jgi:hypothetical protein